MASTFTDLGIELMATGENAGTWGNKTNANLNLIEQLTGGFLEVSIAGSAQTTDLDIDNGALTGKAQNRVLKLTGTITGNQIVTFPLLTENFYIIENGTSGAYTVQLKAASGSGATVTFATDDKGYKFIYLDGVATNTGVFEAVLGGTGDVTLNGVQTLTNKTLTSPKIGTSILDTNGAELFKLTATGSAVNELTYANAATGNKPAFTATGDDTNIGVSIQPKGSGTVTIDALTFPAADGSANQILTTNGSGVLSFVDNSGGTAWQSSVKTANFTAAAGEGYFINTSGGAFEVDLPGSPSVGDFIEFIDFSRNFATANLTLDQGSNKFQGIVASTRKPVLETDGQNLSIVYSGSTQGWIPTTDDDVANLTAPAYAVDFLCIAGGGGGGFDRGGGGGAGGYRNSYNSEASGGGGSSETALQFTTGQVYTITVGDGGANQPSGAARGNDGIASSISGSGITTVTSVGGGGGGTGATPSAISSGGDGGSGGGPIRSETAGSGTANQGFAGGPSTSTTDAGGGGGASEVGDSNGDADGGDGLSSAINGATTRGGGGGGHLGPGRGTGGSGGGGNGGADPGIPGATPGTANTGGGGGGAAGTGPSLVGQAGGTGIVVLRMATANFSGTTTGSPTETNDGSDTILTFNSNGSYTG